MRFAPIAASVALFVCIACGGQRADSDRASLDDASRAYVRLVLALGERDSDSLDSYHGPAEWRAQAQREHTPLANLRSAAVALADSLKTERTAAGTDEDARRRAFLIRQLGAVASRIDILQGARPSFDEEARLLFGLDPRASDAGGEPNPGAAVRTELDRLLPGRGDLATRYAAFDRQFLVPPDRLPAVLSRAIEGCRAATREHVALPDGERVQLDYVRDLPWSAFTRYEGRFVSRVQVNVALPLTVDRTLDLACHEAYPGHHTIAALLDARFGARRPEFLIQPQFSPQSALHEAGASIAPELAFPGATRTAFERDELFPLAGLDASGAARHVAIGRLVDCLTGIEASVARRYLDGALDFPRAAAALEHDALMPSADATLKFVNQFRSYAATYTIGRDALAQVVAGDWSAYLRAVQDPTQMLPSPAGK
ncbi:MAG TPA: hypothetical protein VKE51_39830 [Vicinamibacterales bacterium]|nr:hypothetical protein [Vicinamibacterales bacterium]